MATAGRRSVASGSEVAAAMFLLVLDNERSHTTKETSIHRSFGEGQIGDEDGEFLKYVLFFELTSHVLELTLPETLVTSAYP